MHGSDDAGSSSFEKYLINEQGKVKGQFIWGCRLCSANLLVLESADDRNVEIGGIATLLMNKVKWVVHVRFSSCLTN